TLLFIPISPLQIQFLPPFLCENRKTKTRAELTRECSRQTGEPVLLWKHMPAQQKLDIFQNPLDKRSVAPPYSRRQEKPKVRHRQFLPVPQVQPPAPRFSPDRTHPALPCRSLHRTPPGNSAR